MDAGSSAAWLGEPDVVVRAPGRVNVIGEHTDYSLLPVMPMAIQLGLTVRAVRSDGSAIVARSDAFAGQAVVGLDGPDADGVAGAGGWQAYMAAAVAEAEVGCAARIAIAGDLPPESGLSSSAALLLGTIAALRRCDGAPLDLDDLVRRAIAAEQRLGVRSGGMDQTVVAHAAAGSLLRIDFEPPARRPVTVPPSIRFVVAASGERAAKGGEVRDRYNELVLGARLGALLLSRRTGGPAVTLLGELHCDPTALLDELDSLLELASLGDLGGDDAALALLLPPGFDRDRQVAIRRVVRHALGEAERVDEVEAALRAGDGDAVGDALRRSHASLRDDLRCSTPALDGLCAAMVAAGASGARLTGAGFGGFAVAAVTPARVDEVVIAATMALGGPAFVAEPSDGVRWW